MNHFRQCRMSRGQVVHTAWIPEVHAHKGNRIRLKIDGVWESGWTVEDVGARETEETILENERNYLGHRKATDI